METRPPSKKLLSKLRMPLWRTIRSSSPYSYPWSKRMKQSIRSLYRKLNSSRISSWVRILNSRQLLNRIKGRMVMVQKSLVTIWEAGRSGIKRLMIFFVEKLIKLMWATYWKAKLVKRTLPYFKTKWLHCIKRSDKLHM